MSDSFNGKKNAVQISSSGKISLESPWIPEKIQDLDSIPKGDMPGDKVVIQPDHIQKSHIIFSRLLELLIPALNENNYKRAVVAVYGGSGVGKSEIASLLTYYLDCMNLGSYTLSGDNYSRRIPKHNDAERLRVFRQSGIRGLISHGQYSEERGTILRKLQDNSHDANPDHVENYPWLSIYLEAGRNGLANYLGTINEIDFNELTGIISQFKNGSSKIFIKRMGQEETELWYDCVDFRKKNIMIIEGTHGNSSYLQGVDIPIMLNSSPQETLRHRKFRNRDREIDGPFITMVLGIEQELLIKQASRAKIIVSMKGEILSYDDYIRTIPNGIL